MDAGNSFRRRREATAVSCLNCGEPRFKESQQFCGHCGHALTRDHDFNRAARLVRDTVVGLATKLQTGELTVREVQQEVSESPMKLVKVGHVAYFQVAKVLYELPDSVGVMRVWPTEVLTMAARLQKVYGKPGALRRIAELREAKVKSYVKDEDGDETDVIETVVDENGKTVPKLVSATFDTWGRPERYGEAVSIPK